MVMALLRRQIGEKRAFELVATGRQVPAREALELGLVSRVVSAEDFGAAVEQLVGELCAMPPHALRSTKELFYSLDATNFEDGLARAVRVNVEARSTDEFREGVRRFAPGRRSP